MADIFGKMGARVLSADRFAHEVFRKKNRIHRLVRSLFPEIKGGFTRQKVARIVFQDSGRRRALESLIHPYVFGRIREELKKMRGGVAVLEIPLLFETGFQKDCDRTLVVKASEEKVLDRLLARGFSRAEIKSRRRAQWPAEEKLKRADYVVDNSDGRRKTERQAKKIWRKIQKQFFKI